MIKDDLQEGDTVIIHSSEEFTNFEVKGSIQESIFIQEILSDLLELRREVIKLQKEVSRNKLMIAQLEKKRESYGKEVAKRVGSMLTLINDYGGAMISTDIKEFMGLSKDEFYRTMQCAKNLNLIELLPNPKDGRSYVIKRKPK
jgi:hypothetical protein